MDSLPKEVVDHIGLQRLALSLGGDLRLRRDKDLTLFSSIRGNYTFPYAYKEWILFHIRIYANGYNVFEAIESL